MTRYPKSLVAAAVTLLITPLAHANPGGGTVVAGDVVIAPGSQMVITQSGSSAIVNWNSFSVGAGESVTFNQPNASAAILNRVTGNDASQILGSLTANGRVFLVNPRGIVFGSSAQVDVGSLIATTLDVSDSDFSSGNYRFSQGTANAGGVYNQGTIATQGGNVVLLADQVRNSGTIRAGIGRVALHSGSALTLSFDSGGLVNYQIDSDSTGAAASTTASVGNSGFIDGGSIYLTAAVARTVISTAVNNTGTLLATRIEDGADGSVLLAAAGGDVALGGEISGAGVIVTSSHDISKLTGASLDLHADALNMTAGVSIQLTSDDENFNNSHLYVGSGQAADVDTALISALQSQVPSLVPSSLFANASFVAGDTVAMGNLSVDGGYLLVRAGHVNAQSIVTPGGLFYEYRPVNDDDDIGVLPNPNLPVSATSGTLVFGGGGYSGNIDIGAAQAAAFATAGGAGGDTLNYVFMTAGKVTGTERLSTSGIVAVLSAMTGPIDGGGETSGSGGNGGRPPRPVTADQIAAVSSVTSHLDDRDGHEQPEAGGTDQSSPTVEQQPAEVPCQ
jgi:filamentous hemagglutinin family protein